MVELPEAVILAEQISLTLVGKTISKNTIDMPCPVCGTYIKKEAYMGGSIYYCQGCQH